MGICQGIASSGDAVKQPADAVKQPSDEVKQPGDAVKQPADLVAETVSTALEKATKGEDFTLKGQTFLAKVVEIHDGDTLRVKFDLHGGIVQMRARMIGYDSPEIHPLMTKPGRDKEKKAGEAAAEALRSHVDNKIVTIHCDEFDKFGRLLITIVINGLDVNAWMIKNGHGVPYHGGTKGAKSDKPQCQHCLKFFANEKNLQKHQAKTCKKNQAR